MGYEASTASLRGVSYPFSVEQLHIPCKLSRTCVSQASNSSPCTLANIMNQSNGKSHRKEALNKHSADKTQPQITRSQSHNLTTTFNACRTAIANLSRHAETERTNIQRQSAAQNNNNNNNDKKRRRDNEQDARQTRQTLPAATRQSSTVDAMQWTNKSELKLGRWSKGLADSERLPTTETGGRRADGADLLLSRNSGASGGLRGSIGSLGERRCTVGVDVLLCEVGTCRRLGGDGSGGGAGAWEWTLVGGSVGVVGSGGGGGRGG